LKLAGGFESAIPFCKSLCSQFAIARRTKWQPSTPARTTTSPNHSPSRNWPRDSAPFLDPRAGSRRDHCHRRDRTGRHPSHGAEGRYATTAYPERVRTLALPHVARRLAPRALQTPACRLGRRIRRATGIPAHVHAPVTQKTGERPIFAGILTHRSPLWLSIPGSGRHPINTVYRVCLLYTSRCV